MGQGREAEGAERVDEDLIREVLGVRLVADAAEDVLVDADDVVPIRRFPVGIFPGRQQDRPRANARVGFQSGLRYG